MDTRRDGTGKIAEALVGLRLVQRGVGAGGAAPLQPRHVGTAKAWAASHASLHRRSHLFNASGLRGGSGRPVPHKLPSLGCIVSGVFK